MNFTTMIESYLIKLRQGKDGMQKTIAARILSMLDTYDHSRFIVGCGRIQSLWRTIRWEVFGTYPH